MFHRDVDSFPIVGAMRTRLNLYRPSGKETTRQGSGKNVGPETEVR